MRFSKYGAEPLRGAFDVSECFRHAVLMSWGKRDWERLGDYVTAGRVRADMSRFDLAASAHLSVRTLADIENGELGKRKAFSAETLEAIGACLRWKPSTWRRILNGDEPVYEEGEPTASAASSSEDYDEAKLFGGMKEYKTNPKHISIIE